MYFQIGDMLVADWFLYGLIGVFGVIFVVIFALFYNSRLRIGNKAVVCVLINGRTEAQRDGSLKVVSGVPRVLGESVFKDGEKEVIVKGVKCQVKQDHPAYQKYGWTYYYFEKLTGAIMTFGGAFASLSSSDSDEFLSQTLMARMIRMLKLPLSSSLALIVVGVVMVVVGLAIGIFASPYVLPMRNVTAFTKVVFFGF